MYAHVEFVQLTPDQLETYVHTARMSNLPEAREQPGYKAALMLTDPQSGKAIAISLWETEADRQAIEDSGFADAQRSKSGPLGVTRAREYYQVSFADGNFQGGELPAS